MASVVPPPAQGSGIPARARRFRRFATPRDRTAARGAALGAASAVGALVGFGVRGGASLGRLGVVTLRLRGLPEFVAPDRGALGAAMLGGLHVAVVSGVWGAAAAALAARARSWQAHGSPAVAAALLVALAAVLLALDAVLPAALRLAGGSLVPPERVLATALIVACGGAAGWRSPPSTNAVAAD
jgi:hypothetical protein